MSEKDLQPMSIRIPASLHKKVQMHKLLTGESATALIVRLLQEELAAVEVPESEESHG